MKTWVLLAALQIAALAVLAHRYMQSDLALLSNQNCGLLNGSEFVVTSRNVILPEGSRPAAGKALQLWQILRPHFILKIFESLLIFAATLCISQTGLFGIGACH